MPQVAGMDQVEGAVAHDHAALARARTDDLAQFFPGLDFALVAFVSYVIPTEHA
jgi:hypothetical protein